MDALSADVQKVTEGTNQSGDDLLLLGTAVSFPIARKILCKVPKSDKVFVSPGRLARAVSYSEISILSPK